MNYRNAKILSLLSLLVLLLAIGCGAQTEAPAVEEASQPDAPEVEEMLELTLDELSYYDGKEGRPAYVAVEGIIYDVTDLPLWANGEHKGFSAGQDLTDAIMNEAPHGLEVMERATKVGTLVEDDE